MSAESNASAARRIHEEGFSQGRLDVVDEVCAPDWVTHDPAEPEDIYGAEAHKQRMQGYRTAMSDLQVTVEDVFATEDRAVIRWRAKGTNDGELMGMPPTGKPVEITGTTVNRFDADGKIAETWDHWDNAGFMMQLGISPEALAQGG